MLPFECAVPLSTSRSEQMIDYAHSEHGDVCYVFAGEARGPSQKPFEMASLFFPRHKGVTGFDRSKIGSIKLVSIIDQSGTGNEESKNICDIS